MFFEPKHLNITGIIPWWAAGWLHCCLRLRSLLRVFQPQSLPVYKKYFVVTTVPSYKTFCRMLPIFYKYVFCFKRKMRTSYLGRVTICLKNRKTPDLLYESRIKAGTNQFIFIKSRYFQGFFRVNALTVTTLLVLQFTTAAHCGCRQYCCCNRNQCQTDS